MKTKRILIFSDTHGLHNLINIPENIDIAIFAGDAGTYQNPIKNISGVLNFINWYSKLNIKHKVWIAGNHDTSIEQELVNAKELSKENGLIYLEHESCVIDGLNIFGSPYTPSFGYGWAFNVDRNKLIHYWNEIPTDTDILITHGGPFNVGCLNVVDRGKDVGCEALAHIIETKLNSLKLACSGHIHEGYGYFQKSPDKPLFVNASVLDVYYENTNNPYVVTIDIENKLILGVE